MQFAHAHMHSHLHREAAEEGGTQHATASGCSSFFRHALLNWCAACFSVMLNMQHTKEIPWDLHLMIPLIFYVNGFFLTAGRGFDCFLVL